MTEPLTIVSVAYSLAPVGRNAVGGAEQVLYAIDRALVAAGHHSIVVACIGSAVAGHWVNTGVDPAAPIDEAGQRAAEAATRRILQRTLDRTDVDVMHMHGLDFAQTAVLSPTPTLVTLHLPLSWYPSLAPRPQTWMQCVSESQQNGCHPDTRLLPFIPNGVPVAKFAGSRQSRRGFALMLGRVCPEKGQHLALKAARLANMPLLIGGAIFPYPAHETYFVDEVEPLLDRNRRFLGPLGFVRKRSLLSSASCVLIPSLAPETSSLVAMESIASGTPVIAFRSGALPEIVEHGRTGFLVGSVEEMAAAMRHVGDIDPDICREVARERFSIEQMTAAYLARYEQLALLAQGAAA